MSSWFLNKNICTGKQDKKQSKKITIFSVWRCLWVGAHSPCVYLWCEGLCWGGMALRWCPACLSAVFRSSWSSSRSRSARRDILRAFLRECLSFPTRSFSCAFFLSSSATRSWSCPTRSSSSNNTFCTEEHSSWKKKRERWSLGGVCPCIDNLTQWNQGQHTTWHNFQSLSALLFFLLSSAFLFWAPTHASVCVWWRQFKSDMLSCPQQVEACWVCVCAHVECVWLHGRICVYLSDRRLHVLPEQWKRLNPYCKEPNLSVTWCQRSPHELIA